MVACDRCHRKFANYAALKQHYSNQHPNAKWPDAYEGKFTEEKNLQAHSANLHPNRSSHTKLIMALLLIVIVVGAAWFYLPPMLQTNTTNPECASFPFAPIGGRELAEHYHALLLIYVNGKQVNLPINVGEGDSGPCTQPLHVHASEPNTDLIHVETPQERTYTLGDFFRVWAATPGNGGPSPVVLDQNRIFNYSVGNGYELRLYVNGQQSSAFNTLVIQSQMVVVIVYGNSATDWAHYQNISGQQWPYPDY